MKTSWGWMSGFATGLVCLSASGIPVDSGYQTIPKKNIFRLTEIPPERPTNPEPMALPKIFLTGITTILGNKLVLFRVQYPGRPGESVKEESLVLAEGQRDGGIEVLGVDEVGKQVRVNNSGTEMTLNFEKDGVKPAAGPAVAAAAGTPGVPNQTPTMAPGALGAATNPNPPSASGTPRRFGLGRTLQLPNEPAPPPMPPTTTATPPPSPAALGAPAAAAEAQASGVAKQLTPEEEQLLRLLEQKGQAPQ